MIQCSSINICEWIPVVTNAEKPLVTRGLEPHTVMVAFLLPM